MGAEELMTLISTLGFPIVCAVACGAYIAYSTKNAREDSNQQMKEIREESNKREERLYQQIDKFADTIDKFGETLIKVDSRIEAIEKSLTETK